MLQSLFLLVFLNIPSGVEGIVACCLQRDQPCLMHCRVHAGMLAVWLRSPVPDLPDCLLYYCQRALQELWGPQLQRRQTPQSTKALQRSKSSRTNCHQLLLLFNVFHLLNLVLFISQMIWSSGKSLVILSSGPTAHILMTLSSKNYYSIITVKVNY